MPSDRPPRRRMASAHCSAFSGARSTQATMAPSSASPSAMPPPMLGLVPVTTATLPAREVMMDPRVPMRGAGGWPEAGRSGPRPAERPGASPLTPARQAGASERGAEEEERARLWRGVPDVVALTALEVVPAPGAPEQEGLDAAIVRLPETPVCVDAAGGGAARPADPEDLIRQGPVGPRPLALGGLVGAAEPSDRRQRGQERIDRRRGDDGQMTWHTLIGGCERGGPRGRPGHEVRDELVEVAVGTLNRDGLGRGDRECDEECHENNDRPAALHRALPPSVEAFLLRTTGEPINAPRGRPRN